MVSYKMGNVLNSQRSLWPWRLKVSAIMTLTIAMIKRVKRMVITKISHGLTFVREKMTTDNPNIATGRDGYTHNELLSPLVKSLSVSLPLQRRYRASVVDTRIKES